MYYRYKKFSNAKKLDNKSTEEMRAVLGLASVDAIESSETKLKKKRKRD